MENYSRISTEELLRMATKKDVDAQAALAYRLADEQGDEEDLVSAVEWGEKAYARGRHDVAPLLARLYFNGEGVQHDMVKAFSYCNESKDDIECLCILANEFYSGKNGIEKNDDNAFACISRALSICDNVDPLMGRILYYMGNMYLYGCGVKADVEEAINYYLSSASKGFSSAYIALAECYKKKNDPRKVEFYAEKAFLCADDSIVQDAMNEYKDATRLIAVELEITPCKLGEAAGAYDGEIHTAMESFDNKAADPRKFEDEANRLTRNAQTFDRIGNLKKVYPAYERLANEYPHDFRGWYNMARVFTNDFAVYSIFSVDGYGKLDCPEYYENMIYAQRTIEQNCENELLKICDDYKNGCVSLSVHELKNDLYAMFAGDDCADKIAEYARKFESKITYLYNNRPCNTTALALHVLLNVLNNDNIKKYNEKVRQHNQKLDEKVEGAVNDYIIELAQKLKIENPKDYASNAEAMQAIGTDKEAQEDILNYRNSQKAMLEYYSEITALTVCDVYDEDKFGEDRPYKGYQPHNECEYDDDFVDFAVALAEKCSIQMRGYKAFYSPEGIKKCEAYIASENVNDAIRLDYFNRASSLKQKYTDMQPDKSRAFEELVEIMSEYTEAYSAYERSNGSNVFKQVFKGKELKESKEGTKEAYDAAFVKLDDIKNKIIAGSRNEINALNNEFVSRYTQLDMSEFLYAEDSFIGIIIGKFEKLKNNKV